MRHLVSFAFLAAALVAYLASAASAMAGGLFVIGLLLEAVFWYRMLATKSTRTRGS